jgi:ABC-type multidrug transport system fused ATPase/permease subunit
MARVPDEERRARVRLLLALAFTLVALVFTMFGSFAEATFVGWALTVTVVGVFLTTWFGLDVWITHRSARERAYGSGGITPMTGAKPRR